MMASHLNTGDGTYDMVLDEIDRPMMSIKDRIRAMNLVAERSSITNPSGVSSFRGKSPDVNRSKHGTTACDLSTLVANRDQRKKPTGLSSDPGVGNDEDMAAAAIHMWRRRKGDEKKVPDAEEGNPEEDDDDDTNDNAAWTISDLTKGNTRKCVQTPRQERSNILQNIQSQIREDKPIEWASSTAKIDNQKGTVRNERNPSQGLKQLNDATFVMPKLKPVKEALHTLALVNALTSPNRNGSEGMQRVNTEDEPPPVVVKNNRNAVPMSPKRIEGIGNIQLKKMERNPVVSNRSMNGSNKGSNSSELSPRSSRLEQVKLKKVDRSMSTSNAPDYTIKSKPTQNQLAEINPTPLKAANDTALSKKKSGTPQRSKISDRIKAFSSAANGSNWKHKSPARYAVPPSAPFTPSNVKRQSRNFGQQHGEDSSCASSERQSNDDDSVSVSTPMMGNPARLGAQPPTPNSYSSETAYMSVASSGDGAVAGSFASTEQNVLNQMNYAHVSTPSSSVQGDSSTASPRHDQVVVTKSTVKNTLQSKLEYDKERAARRSKMARNQIKVPSALVAAQKKAQDEGPKPKWGANQNIIDVTPTRPSQGDVASLMGTPTSLDEDPTIQEQSFEHSPVYHDVIPPPSISQSVPKSVDEFDSVKAVQKIPISESMSEDTMSFSFPKSKNEDTTSSGKPQMKAGVMKQLINKRRRRRKEIQTVKKDAEKDVISALTSPKRTSIGEYCVRSRGIEKKKTPLRKSAIPSKALSASVVNFTAAVSGKRKATLQDPKDKAAENEPKAKPEPEPEPDLKLKRVNASLQKPIENHSVTDKVQNKTTALQEPRDKAGPEFELESEREPDLKLKRVNALLQKPSENNFVLDQLKDNKKDSNVSANSPITFATDQAPPLPPNIIRSTQSRDRKEADETPVQDSQYVEQSKTIPDELYAPTDESAPDSPSSSVSIALSVLIDEFPDDEDEPEPVVDSFIDMDLSPVRRNDVSKNIFDTSTSYRSSPESLAKSSAEQPPHRPGHIRDLIGSKATPKRANRHVSLRTVGEMLYQPEGTPLDYSGLIISTATPDRHSNINSSAPADGIDSPIPTKPRFVLSDFNELEEPYSTFRNHCSDAFSDVSSGIRSSSNASATSSAVSVAASRANKILSERRAKSKKKPDSGGPSADKEHATNLARKIMSSEQEPSPTDTSRKSMRGKEAIKEALMANRTLDSNKAEKAKDFTATPPRNETSAPPTDKKAKDVTATSPTNETAAAPPTGETEEYKNRLLQNKMISNTHELDIDPLPTGTGQNSTCTSDLDMDVDNIDKSGHSEYGSIGPDAGCLYPMRSNCQSSETSSWLQMDKHMSLGLKLACGDIDDLQNSNFDSLDISTTSAVRISQHSEDEDQPFDEGEGAIEVELISDENIVNVSIVHDNDNSILMHTTSNPTDKEEEGYFSASSNVSLKRTNVQTPNYISESSCDTSDSVDYQIFTHIRQH